MKLTEELILGAATDLNAVLKLNPAIVTSFGDTDLKGPALKAVKEKFIDQVKKDLIECASLVNENDSIKESTVDVLEAIGVEGIRDKVKSIAPETVPSASAPTEEKETVAEKKEESPPRARSAGGGGKSKEVKEVKPKEQPKAKAAKKPPAAPKKAVEPTRELDQFGFGKGSYSSEAIKMLAAGKPAKDVRKKFNTLSFSKLIQSLESHGFKVKEDDKGVYSITAKK
jgi:hypothetical protein